MNLHGTNKNGDNRIMGIVEDLISRWMPQIIANNILLGYNDDSVFVKRRIPARPELYNRFLRLNNRRKTVCEQDFQDAGYFQETFHGNFRQELVAINWCRKTFGNHGYWRNRNRFWFATQDDALLFKLSCD